MSRRSAGSNLAVADLWFFQAGNKRDARSESEDSSDRTVGLCCVILSIKGFYADKFCRRNLIQCTHRNSLLSRLRSKHPVSLISPPQSDFLTQKIQEKGPILEA
jgi:hypothetical protein